MESNIKSMKSILKYVVTTVDRGLLLKPNAVWNGRRDFLLEVKGMSESDYAKDDSNKSVSGWYTFLNGAATSFRRKSTPIIALSATEADLFLAVMCAQDMLFSVRILNIMVFKVKLLINI